jgi:hypothetical protein
LLAGLAPQLTARAAVSAAAMSPALAARHRPRGHRLNVIIHLKTQANLLLRGNGRNPDPSGYAAYQEAVQMLRATAEGATSGRKSEG